MKSQIPLGLSCVCIRYRGRNTESWGAAARDKEADVVSGCGRLWVCALHRKELLA